LPGIKYFCLLLGLSVLFKVTTGSCSASEIPNTVLWAWQRSEDLSTLASERFAVAYFACHVVLSGEETKEFWRNQPLKVKANTKLIPVMRLDCDRKNPPALTAQQLERTAAIMRKLSALPQTAAVQIDFDALQSQRDFYKNLLELVKAKLPPKIPLSITALASWCLYDNWIKDLPVDETVPMMFSLGDERQKILLYFRSGHGFLQKSCCQTLGLSLEDMEMNQLMIPLARNRKIPVRVYLFTRNAWTAKKISAAQTMLGQP
jgi:hypothetical protein